MLKFAKSRVVKSPNRANKYDAGIDFFIPEFNEKFFEDFKNKNETNHYIIPFYNDSINVQPGGRVLIPAGIHVNVEPGYALIAFNKSGVAVKKGLSVGACVIDSGYQGEVHINLFNNSLKDVSLYEGDKIVQFIYLPVRTDECEEFELIDLYEKDSSRGTGGFGSSGEK